MKKYIFVLGRDIELSFIELVSYFDKENILYKILDSYQNLFDQLFIAAQKNFSTKAVIFYIDSPGGEVTACDKLFNEVLKLKTYGIKTVAFVNSMSASGAYYITANSDKIVASPTSIVGSIGVIMELYNFEGLAGKIGLKIETIKSIL